MVPQGVEVSPPPWREGIECPARLQVDTRDQEVHVDSGIGITMQHAAPGILVALQAGE